jgi:MinD-like ATPase involved in chromosome partitioning or flagellar assembly
VISLKGGVGKTTTTAALGAMFANLRGDRVIAVDANPDRGTLIERVPRQSGATVRHLLEARDRVTRYGDVRAFTSQSPTRLEVLASDADPSASSALSERDYRSTVDTLERFYNLILTDCGTGLLHDAMRGVLGLATSLVVVSSASLDGARSASATLDWLEAHGMEQLAKDAVVVISSVRPGGGIVDVMQLEDHFAARCRAVVTIPYDGHLEAGGVLDLDELDAETLDAYKELAAAVGEGFSVRG